jgi:hypothetical protein
MSHPSLPRALAEALVDLAWFVERTDDDRMDQDDGVKALEGVAEVADRLSDSQRPAHDRDNDGGRDRSRPP